MGLYANASLTGFNLFDCLPNEFLFLFYLFIYFCLFRAVLLAYGGSQARGPIGAVGAGLLDSHSNARFEPCLQPTSQLAEMPDP